MASCKVVLSAVALMTMVNAASAAELLVRGDSLRLGSIGNGLVLPDGSALDIEVLARRAHPLQYEDEDILIFRLDEDDVVVLGELASDQFPDARLAGFGAHNLDLAFASRFDPSTADLDIVQWLDRSGRLVWRPVAPPMTIQDTTPGPSGDAIFSDRFEPAEPM